MKRIILLVATISFVGFVRAQENTLEVYLAKAEQVLKMQGQAVKAIDFENNYVWAITDSFLVRLNKVDKSITYYSYPFTDEKGSSYIIKVDKNGVKWIARSEYLRNGGSFYESYSSSIYSFDGNQWEKDQSLGIGRVISLYVDKNNCIWIVKQGKSGLFKIEQDSFIQYTPENSGLLYDYVNKVVSDNDGNIWMLNYGNVHGIGWAYDVALIKYDYAGDKWTSYPYGGDGPYPTPYIQIDNEGNPWFRPSFDVVQKFDVASNSWSEKIYTSPPNIISPLDTIEVEKDSWYTKEWPTEFYYTNKDSIAVYDGSDWSFYTSSNSALQFGEVYSIATDSEGTTWIGTENGLVSFNENGAGSTEEPQASNENGLTTATDSYSKKMNDIELFPNPANDFIILKMPGVIQKSRVDILNIQGKTLKTFRLNQSQNLLDVSQLSTGVYLFRIQSEGNYIMRKFVKQ